MRKEDLRLLFLHEFKLGNKASQTTANINRAWGEGTTSDRTVRRWFQKFRSGDESLEDEEGRGRPSILDNENLRVIVEQNPRQSVRETWCQQFNSVGPSEANWQGEKDFLASKPKDFSLKLAIISRTT